MKCDGPLKIGLIFKLHDYKMCLFIFLNVGPPKEDNLPGHLLSPIFQSSYTLQLQISLFLLNPGPIVNINHRAIVMINGRQLFKFSTNVHGNSVGYVKLTNGVITSTS